MAGYCPAPGPDDPLVRSLIRVVDCNVQGLVHGGYSALFQPSSPFSVLLTTLMTLYVAFLGFGLLLGRTQLRISDLVLTVVKLGAVLALATQWDTYQTVVYNFLFLGPEQLATAMLDGVRSSHSLYQGDVFDGLQLTFDQLNLAAAAYSKGSPAQASPLLGGAASGAMLLTLSGGLLLLSSLGVLLAAKVVLGLLLAAGPVFIALFLFDSTRGVFEGWLRASLAFAFAPLAATLLLGVALTMLEPSLTQLAELRARNEFPLGPVYSVFILVLVFTGVALGLLIAGGMIAAGFKLPERRSAPATPDLAGPAAQLAAPNWMQPRAVRIAAAASAMERRDGAGPAGAPGAAFAGSSERRTSVATLTTTERGSRDGGAPAAVFAGGAEPRLGQGTRRSAGPRASRDGRRNVR